MDRKKGILTAGILAFGLYQGCGIVALRTPEEYKDKKLSEDPPAYEQDDKGILDAQK